MKHIDKTYNEVAFYKAKLIDEQLLIFLKEQGYSGNNVGKLKEELKKNGFEIMHDIKFLEESEVHTFKICKIYAKKSLNIPNPQVSITP